MNAYVICSTPRTGSTLLCALLESTGVAGHPQSYFRKPDEEMWAAQWGIPRAPHGGFEFADYLRAAIEAGRTENGVFGVRIMWGSMDEVVENLQRSAPGVALPALTHLTRAFGHTRFIHLERGDILAQAVSWWRAEQTEVWHLVDGSEAMPPASEPKYDFDRIHGFVEEIGRHHAAWRAWFRRAGVEPHRVTYEDLDTDPVGVTRGVLDHLRLELPCTNQIAASNLRLADEINVEWMERYRLERSPGASRRQTETSDGD